MSMPTFSAAWITVVPSGASISRPSIVSFGISVLSVFLACFPARPLRAAPLRDSPGAHRLKLASEFGDEAPDRHHVGIRERTNRFSFHHICDFIEQVHIGSLPFSGDQVSHDL